jgi:hypothetical protein
MAEGRREVRGDVTQRKRIAGQAHEAIADDGLGHATHAAVFVVYGKASGKIRHLVHVQPNNGEAAYREGEGER